jgi:integrase
MARPAFNRSKDGWFLLQSGLNDKTIDAYRRHVRLFLEWCALTNIQFSSITTTDMLDDIITDYLHHRYELLDGAGRQGGENLVNGLIMLMPRLKGRLLTARRALAMWKKIVPPESYPPLTRDLAVVVAVQMSRHGYYRYAVGVLLSFDCLLRVSEMSSLKRENVVDSGDLRFGSVYRRVTITIPQTKGGPNQSVTISDPAVVQLIRDLVRRTKPGKPLFPGGVHSYRRVFNRTRDELGLSSKYGTHSLRHGGATLLFLKDVALSEIMLRGRWKAESSARTYIQQAPAILAAMQAPAAVTRSATVLARDVVLSLALSQRHSAFS